MSAAAPSAPCAQAGIGLRCSWTTRQPTSERASSLVPCPQTFMRLPIDDATPAEVADAGSNALITGQPADLLDQIVLVVAGAQVRSNAVRRSSVQI